ncbi:hypothetical protein [Fulvitalea axinellae]
MLKPFVAPVFAIVLFFTIVHETPEEKKEAILKCYKEWEFTSLCGEVIEKGNTHGIYYKIKCTDGEIKRVSGVSMPVTSTSLKSELILGDSVIKRSGEDFCWIIRKGKISKIQFLKEINDNIQKGIYEKTIWVNRDEVKVSCDK